jgi:ABC-type branched-subunit amino acid transport system substrate-binding protein
MAKNVIKFAALTGIAGLALAACSTGSSTSSTSTPSASSTAIQAGPGVDVATKTITLGVLTPLSGAAALIGKPLTAGQQAYFSYVNAHGGIDGWKVTLDIKDDQYNPQLHVQDYNQIVNSVAFIAQSLGSPTTQAIEATAQQNGVLIGTAAQSSAFVNSSVNAVIGTPYAVDVANALYYLTNTLGKKNAKVGIVYQNDAYGADGLKGYLAAKAAYHFNDVAHATYAVTDTSFTSQALAMKNAGAQYVVVTAIPTAAATLIGTAAAIGYHPQWILQGPAWSEYLMTSTGVAGGKPTPVEKAMVGAWVLGYEAAWGDMSVPGMSQFLAIQKQYAPTQVPDGYYMYGYCLAEMEAQLLAKAIASKNLTRAGLLSAKEHLGTVNFGGLIPTATYTPANGPADRQTDIAVVDLTSPGFLKIMVPYFESSAASSMTFAS